MKNNSFFIANGNYIVPAAIIVTIVLFMICSVLGFLSAVISIFLYKAFKNDTRDIFVNTQNILSPIDGEVMAIDIVNNKKKIYCKKNIFQSAKFLSPVKGEVKTTFFQKGINLNPNSFKASILNEQLRLTISNEDFSLQLDLISGKFNTPLENNISDLVDQGEYIITFFDGVTVITLDENIELNVKLGDKLKAGQTKLNKN